MYNHLEKSFGNEFDFLYGYPNQNSYPFFIKLFGYTKLYSSMLQIEPSNDFTFENLEQTIQFDINITSFNEDPVYSEYIIWKIDESLGEGCDGQGFDIGLETERIHFRHWDNNHCAIQANISIDYLLQENFNRITFSTDHEFLKAYINGVIVDSAAITENYQIGKGNFNRRRYPKNSELDINKSIKSQFNHMRINDNELYPSFFKYKNSSDNFNCEHLC